MSTPPPPPPRRHGRGITVLAVSALIALVLAAGMVAAVFWLLHTPGGLTTIARVVTALTPVRLVIESPQGSLRNGFAIGRLKVTVDTIDVEIRDLRGTLVGFGLEPLRFDFSALAASAVDVHLRPGAPSTGGPPDTIASPVAVTVGRLEVGEFGLRIGADPDPVVIAARAIDAGVALGPDGYRIDRAAFEFGRVDAPLRATASGTLGGARPFSLQADAALSSSFQDKPLGATANAAGSLERFTASGQVNSGGANGSFAITIAAFSTPTLQEIHADLRGIDPRTWSAAAPKANLHVQADLKPTNAAQFGLAGLVRVENSAPGPIDTGLLPARSATGTVNWSGERLALDNVVAELVRGSARGKFAVTFGSKVAWQTEAQFSAVDPSTIHRKLRPMRLDGNVKARQEGSDTLVLGELRNRGAIPAELKVDLRVSAERLAINAAHLVLGKGNVDVVGEMALTGTRRVHLTGSAVDLDPSVLIEGANARVTGIFALDAHLEPQMSGDLDFELAESQAFGRPFTGRGTASLSQSQQLSVDVDLAVRSARVHASGGLGAPDRTLNVDIDAPALDELGLPVKGGLTGHATLRGDWRAPAVDAQAQGKNLVYGPHTVETVHATLTYAGGSDGAFSLQTDLLGHRWSGNPVASLRAAALTADGRPSAHSLSLYASYNRDQTARVVAKGQWSERRWRGQLAEANMGAPLDLRLLEAAAVELDEKGVRFGPAHLVVIGATVSQLQLDVHDGVIATSGRFDEWRPAEFFNRQQVNMIPRGKRDPLEIRGAWRIRAGDVVEGELNIERTSGDLYATAGNEAPMGVTDLGARATVRANHVEAEGTLRGTRLGTLNATLATSLERDRAAGWRLAQASPWRIDADADLPSIEWVNALLSERVRSSIRIGGRLNGKMSVLGTPAKPDATGRIEGNDLRVAWIEQGVRLENGHLAVHLEADGLVLDELRFAGPPRVKPNDARTAQTMAKMEPGYVAATGKFRLRDTSGVIQIQAERLPLLQRVDRWVVVSGGANMEFAPKRVQLNGAVAVVAGFIDFSHPDLPSLSSDVTVIDSSTATRERETPVQVGFDLGLDLGPAAYLHGSGLDTRVSGAVRVRSEGRSVRASGEVRAVDGVFQGYGQKLKIKRGRVIFQGQLDNPGLDVLALRPDLPQDAGDIGVSITGTAANPQIRLYSDPELTEYQTLSWLVLGRAADASGSDNVALARAALGLLSGTGEGIPNRLARSLGIDEIGLRSGQLSDTNSLLPRQSVAGNLRGGDTFGTAGGSASTDIVTLGKRVNEAFSISYEQALQGAGNVVAFTYQLSRRISLVARAGTENTLDVVFSLAFD